VTREPLPAAKLDPKEYFRSPKYRTAGERAERRRTEIAFRCELCEAVVHVVRGDVLDAAPATQQRLARQAQRDHCAKTGCAGVRPPPDELDAISAELFGGRGAAMSSSTEGLAAAPSVQPTPLTEAALARGLVRGGPR
jgi:hypothetical protein